MLIATAEVAGLWYLACMFVASPYAVNAVEAVSAATGYRNKAVMSFRLTWQFAPTQGHLSQARRRLCYSFFPSLTVYSLVNHVPAILLPAANKAGAILSMLC